MERVEPVIRENAELGELFVAVRTSVPVRQTIRVPPVAVVVVFSLESTVPFFSISVNNEEE
jgi:hypothetical protein